MDELGGARETGGVAVCVDEVAVSALMLVSMEESGAEEPAVVVVAAGEASCVDEPGFPCCEASLAICWSNRACNC